MFTREVLTRRGGHVSEAMRAFRTFLGHSDMMAARHIPALLSVELELLE
jgi:hypothetical protein